MANPSMTDADWIQIGIAALTAVAAGAAWCTAWIAGKSVKEQAKDNEQAAEAAKKQMAALDEQIRIFAAQTKAAEEHAGTAKRQSEAEAVRWVFQQKLEQPRDRITQRLSFAIVEYFMFRGDLLPWELFLGLTQEHATATFLTEAGLGMENRPKWWRRAPIANVARDGELAHFLFLWDTIDDKIIQCKNQLAPDGRREPKTDSDIERLVKEVFTEWATPGFSPESLGGAQ